jgi:tetratricopeptide (TPR) repeat protein
LNLAELARQTAREIAEGKAVIFLGVGASVGTESEWNEGKGVLSSGELTRAIAERFGVNLQYDGGGELASTLRGVASLAVLERHPGTVKRFVIEKISPGCGKPLRVHRALARVAPTIVMTTNYDNLYEAAMQEAGKDCERIVQSSDLVGLPINRPRVLKLHGDKEQPNEIVLTGPDYMAWRKRAAGLQAEVVAAVQKHVCVFVGYSVSDENLGDVLKIISENLDTNAPKHFAVVHEIDKERAAELHGSVEFVEGEATRFCEMLAEEFAVLSPRPRDPQRERATFEAQLEAGDLVEAGQSCENLAQFLIACGENAGAASLWRSFGEAAESVGEHSAAAAAFREAGNLLWESGYALDAERALSAALRESQNAGESAIEREVHPLLKRVRLSEGGYHEVLDDTERELRAYGGTAPPSLVYTLREVRAEAQEIIYGIDEALGELHAALDVLPEDAKYLRTKAWAAVARLLADKYEWEEAHVALNTADSEVTRSTDVDDAERRRCAEYR